MGVGDGFAFLLFGLLVFFEAFSGLVEHFIETSSALHVFVDFVDGFSFGVVCLVYFLVGLYGAEFFSFGEFGLCGFVGGLEDGVGVLRELDSREYVCEVYFFARHCVLVRPVRLFVRGGAQMVLSAVIIGNLDLRLEEVGK